MEIIQHEKQGGKDRGEKKLNIEPQRLMRQKQKFNICVIVATEEECGTEKKIYLNKVPKNIQTL